ncbi:Transcriptional regulator containing PAS, AAA-type ATPase, and DNA-binding Fis domains [Dethiosulfatibacter aminovorans DSM 17477]|uniref:Transcriptional regulator containing PAS, AAA-type ATPase, and DNA-binding Fis domains n=1 Tax=Dethiosulfatibacter aminovorans DSM 17477 TaxID=1121476 RepID=A0A1M6N1E3_9FIRM|nr:sigma 54-interacting transcriptional regulator [Dethiosulfatibacter aminovorans]SHJ89539.1 Transcriptional regulator containing PAS, AAA-type ATPase, and DNA-binding Fis domains [Dethiosulfatibacter aminovorans DSM 17477]
MKLKVAVFFFYEETIHYYTTILKQIFEDYVDIEMHLVVGIDSIVPFYADVVLNTGTFVEQPLRQKCLNSKAKFINISVTIDGSCLDELRELPRGSECLLVSCDNIYSWNTMVTLEQLGIDNVKFIPYFGQKLDLNGINIATYMGIKTYDLEGINRYIDIGWRIIHPYVIRRIGEEANLSSDFIENKISNYVKDESKILDYWKCVMISKTSEFIKDRLELLDFLENPTILINEQMMVLGLNESFRDEFHIDIERMIGNTLFCSALLTEINAACTENGGTGIYQSTNGRQYQVVLKPAGSYVVGFYNQIIIELKRVLIKDQSNESCYRFKDIVHESESMNRVIELARHFANTDYTILIEGESGTGKELLAHSIHAASKRSSWPFIAVNCGAFSETLLESELFGYAGGAFTGALRTGKKGMLEAANGGTIFLDEIGEASLKMQVKLLRFLQEKEVKPVGSNIVKNVDVRVICATNIDMEKAVSEGTIRDDFFYRLSAVTLFIPPLRERKEDIDPLLRSFLGCGTYHLDEKLQNFLHNWNWPGNARELKGCAEYILSFGSMFLKSSHLPERYRKKITKGFLTSESDKTSCLEKEKNIEIEILKCLEKNSMGRRGLVNTLSSKGTKFSEYAIRQALENLKEKGWITIGRGREATMITEEGKKQIQ